MLEFQKRVEDILRSEMTNAGLEIIPKENGRVGVDFIIKSQNGKESEVLLQAADLTSLQSVKIRKEKLGEPRENLWAALVGIIEGKEPLIFLIPTKTIASPDDFVFFENNVDRHTYLSNWEIKVFTNGMKKLGEYVSQTQFEHFK